MNDSDFLKWRNLDWLGPRKRPQSAIPRQAPPVHISTDRYALNPSFEDRLTFEDKLFLESVGIAITP